MISDYLRDCHVLLSCIVSLNNAILLVVTSEEGKFALSFNVCDAFKISLASFSEADNNLGQ